MKKGKVLKELLDIELHNSALKCGFIDGSKIIVTEKLLVEAISVLNELSVNTSEKTSKYLISICALLWTYKDDNWDGLKDYLTLFLSRAGFGPSSIMVDNWYLRTNICRKIILNTLKSH